MKNVLFIIITIIMFISCNKESKYVTFSGKISNPNTDSLIIFHPEMNYTKVIKLKEDGTFKDTLKVENGQFSMTNSKDFTLLYLINGDDITMNFDANNFNETINFIGSHAVENNFLATSTIKENAFFSNAQLMNLPKNEFDTKVSTYINDFNSRLNNETLDSYFVTHQQEEIENFKEYIEKEYLEKNYGKLVLTKGKPSPKFVNYENFKGGNTSLDDLKGKYVYIDVWATWCNPCKAEIPSLQKIEKEFHGRNIQFVSISIDDERDYDTWKTMVANMNLGGIQLYAKGDKKFNTEYRIKSIPRFILIDDKGNIVEADAPRPSSSRLKELLNSLPI